MLILHRMCAEYILHIFYIFTHYIRRNYCVERSAGYIFYLASIITRYDLNRIFMQEGTGKHCWKHGHGLNVISIISFFFFSFSLPLSSIELCESDKSYKLL